MSDLFYRRRRLLILTIGLIAVAGLSSLQALPRQEDPNLSRRFGDIITTLPGATADRVESQITEKIEAKILELHEVKDLESLSRTGLSVINVGLEDEYDDSNVDEVWSRLRDKLSDLAGELPEGASVPIFTDRTSTAITLLVGFTWEGEGPPQLSLMTRLAKELQSRLRPLGGTKETEIYGAAAEELRVTVDPLRAAEVGIDAATIAATIGASDTRKPTGQLQGDRVAMPFEIDGQLTSVERVRRIPLGERNGRVLRVGDVADVEKTRLDPPETLALLAGEPGVALSATMLASSGRVDLWAARARGIIEEFHAEVPPGIGYRLLFDQSTYVEERLETLVGNLVLGAFIVVLVLLVMMGVRSAIVVACALPLTLGLVLAEMNFIGMPLHQTSLTGLILALGLLIDNAIVVVDEFELRLRRGLEPGAAVRAVVSDLFIPLGASTLTTVLAFLPIVLMPGPGGEFVGPIAVGVGLAVASSFFLATTVILTLAAILIPRRRARASDTDGAEEGAHGGWREWLEHGYHDDRATALYRRTVVAALRRPAIGIGVSIVLPVLGFAVMGQLPEQFFPANDRDQFQVQLDLPAHATIEATLDAIDRAKAVIEAHEGVVESHWFAGQSTPRVYYNIFFNNDVPNFAGGFVVTDSPATTEAILPRLQEELIEAIPEALAIALPFEQGPPFDAPIEVRVVGPELEQLRRLGDEVRAILAQTNDVTYTRAKLIGGRPKLVLAADEDAAEMAGLRFGQMAEQLNAALDGAIAGRILEGNEEIPIRVRGAAADRASLARVGSTRLMPPGGAAMDGRVDGGALAGVPVDAIANISLEPDLAGITRHKGERVNTVQAFLVPYALIQESLDDFIRRLDESGLELPAGYRIDFGGDFEQRSEAIANLAAFALPLLVLMAGSIILTFDSFRFASIIYAVAFLSVGLAMLSVWTFGHPLGFVVIVGAMGLAGLAINDAIVVLNALRLDPRAAEGDPESTADVVLDATRHILATTFTTIGGFLPLIISGGRFWPPMATAIAGGVLGASIIALYFVPTLFAITRRKRGTAPATAGVLTMLRARLSSAAAAAPRS